MPGLRTAAQIREQALRRADMATSSFVTAAEVDQYVLDSAGELVDLILENCDVEHFAVLSSPIATIAGTPEYALPSDFYRLLGVDLSYQGDLHPLRRLTFRERRFSPSDRDWGHPSGVRYSLLNREIAFNPVPKSEHTFFVWYVPLPVSITNMAANPFQSFTGWDEYIIVDVAAKCLEKEESDSTALRARKLALAERIATAARKIDSSDMDTIADTQAGIY